MRTLTLLFSFMVAFPFVLSAQSAGELLQKVSTALSEGQDDYAVSLFRQSVKAGADQTEMFYWTQVEKNSAVAPRLVNELATYYKRKRNYDKAYLFYREFLQYHSDDVPALVSCAEMEMMRGKEKDAVKTYEKVLILDANNLQANIFLGNYFYLQAEREKKKLEDDYKKILLLHECNMPVIVMGFLMSILTAIPRQKIICSGCCSCSLRRRQEILWKRLRS